MGKGLQERDEVDWNHTASIVCVLANINRDTKKRPRPFHPDEFHPYRRRKVRGMALTGDVIRAQAEAWRAREGRKSNGVSG